MKNKLMYLVAVLFAACVGFSSCSDDDDKIDETLTGTWNYGTKGDIYFEFEYKEDKIEIPDAISGMLPNEIKAAITALFPDGKIPVASVKQLLAPYAKQQMQKYFRGINFISDKDMEILVTVNGQPESIKTTYEIQGSVIRISTQSDDFKDLTNNMIPETVPSIDLNYFFKDKKLTLYVSTTYAKTILGMVPGILAATGTIPAEYLPAVTSAVQAVSNNITKLELGPVLVR